MAKDINHDIDIERNQLKHLIQDEAYCRSVFMFGKIVNEHFTDLFHQDAFISIREFFEKYGTTPSSPEKLNQFLSKNTSYTDTFKTKESQMKIWLKSVERLFNPLTSEQIKDKDVEYDLFDQYRRKRLIQEYLVQIQDDYDNNNVEDALQLMSDAVVQSKVTDNAVMEGNIVDDLDQHLLILEQQKNGMYQPIPYGILGAIENEESNTHKIVGLDDLLDGGSYPGEMTIIVGENNIGKSFALMEAAFYASYVKKNVIIITIEMNKIKEERRIYSRMTNIPYSKFKMGTLSQDDVDLLKKKVAAWEKNCGILHVVSFDQGATVIDVASKLKDFEMKYKEKVDLVVIDYLNDMKPVGKYASAKGWDAFGEISFDLAQLAKYWNNHEGVPVLTANQKKASRAGTAFTDWQDAAFSPLPLQHATVGIGIGQSDDDEEIGRVRWDIFKARDGGKGMSFYTYPRFEISRIHSKKRMTEYYEETFGADPE